MKIAVILHLYYLDLWDEFSLGLAKLDGFGFELFVTLTIGSSSTQELNLIQKRISSKYPNTHFFILENKGLDIGSFLTVLKSIIESEQKYDFILKLHSKKSLVSCGPIRGEYWRKELYEPLLCDIDNLLAFFSKNKHVGMIGSKAHLYNFEGANSTLIYQLKKMLGITTEQKVFIGGTMFWVRFSILKHYLTEEKISQIYEVLEEGYFLDSQNGKYTHAMERIFGYMVLDKKLLIAGA